MKDIQSLIPQIKKDLSIIVIGCGGIVNDAHLPAYTTAGYTVLGLFDQDEEKAKKTGEKFGIKNIFTDRKSVIDAWNDSVIFDIAVPAKYIAGILEWLPENCAVLIQKPLGDDLKNAGEITKMCADKKIRAAVNFQLRYAPAIIKARELVNSGILGEIRDIEVRVTCNTPWSLWPFVYDIPRMEILYHSIHYVDLIRSFCGNPVNVYAKTIGAPESERIKNSRTTLIMDYGDRIRANIETNHLHQFGSDLQESYFKCEGTKGAVKANLGVNLNYPKGEPDYLIHYDLGEPGKGWQDIPIAGNWFPHAFIGSMGSVLLAEDGQIDFPPTHAKDAFQTMAVLEAAYHSSAQGGTPLNAFLSHKNL